MHQQHMCSCYITWNNIILFSVPDRRVGRGYLIYRQGAGH